MDDTNKDANINDAENRLNKSSKKNRNRNISIMMILLLLYFIWDFMKNYF